MRWLLPVLLVLSVHAGGCSCRGDDANNMVDGGVDAPPDAGPDEMICTNLPANPSGQTCEVESLGAAKLIKGNVMTPATMFRGGQVAVDANGQITCVGCDCAKGGETVITCPNASISPGLINTHDHITFTQNAPYNDTGERYDDRQQWRKGLDSHTKIPSAGGASGVKISWGELRFLMGGATSTVGSGGQAGLLRNLDDVSKMEGMSSKKVDFVTFPLGDSSGTRQTANCNYGTNIQPSSLNAYDSFEPHTSEGVDAYAANEFRCQSDPTYDTTVTTSPSGTSVDLLLPKTAMIHAIGLTADNYGSMALKNTALIWSPRSNITLYGDTARVTIAARQGVEIALGTDWTPTGSMNMLRELRCADSLNKTYYDKYFTDKQLWEMTTVNAAAVTATDGLIGILAPNHVADISIFKGKSGGAYRTIIDADPQDVSLVMRGGKVLYGDDAAVTALASDCDTVDVCGSSKRVCLKSEIGKTWTELQAAVGTIYPAFFCGEPDKEPSCTPKRPASVNNSTIYSGAVAAGTDSDGDGIADSGDNCPKVFNPARPMDNGMQPDADSDGQGDPCDPCPTDANTTTCTPVNPDDRDHDGVLNSADNCPQDPNPAQTDGDSDGKGDVCDPCPSDANPGSAGCPTTIYKIKQGMVPDGSVVRIQNALVTAKGANGFFVQTKAGDAGYAGVDYSGLFVYTGPMTQTLTNAVVGLRVTIDGTVTTYQQQLEITPVTAVTPTTLVGEALPDAVAASYTDVKTGGAKAAQLESVLVTISGSAAITATNPTYGEYTLTSGADSLVVDDFLFVTPPAGSAVGTNYNSVTGILALRQQASKLEPRSQDDLVQGSPTLATFGPALSYVRAGQNGVNTFPAGSELTVTLSGPAQGDTDVTVAATTGATVVGGKVTVPDGQTSAKVVLDGDAQTTDVTLTATLGASVKTAHVRVLGATEAPTTVALSPATASVGPNASTQLTVSLNIPAPAGGIVVDLGISPSNAGTTNPATQITIAADTLSSTFTYTDASGSAATISASFTGSNTATTSITVAAGSGHLVINEVDYDNTGPVQPNDNAEYIEIYNPTGASISLANTALVLINGGTGDAYPTADSIIDLSSLGAVPPGGYLVVAGGSVTVPTSALKFDPGWTTDEIQNGSPDGLALVDTSSHTLIDALSYEGSITMADVPGIANPVSLVEGTALSTSVADSNTLLGALCRSPNGKDTNAANTDWKFCTTLTPGAANP